MREQRLKISFNSPVVLGFTVVCFGALILSMMTGGKANHLFFSVYRSSLMSPLTYIRFVGHVFGHAGWEHFLGNIMLILVVGPLLEEKYGSANLLFVVLATALVTGIANFALSCCPFYQYERRGNPIDFYTGGCALYRAANLSGDLCQ